MSTHSFRFRVGVLLAFGPICTSAALGDGPLFPGAQYSAGGQSFFVAIADLDGDQVPDLAMANPGINKVSVLLGVGDGTFAAAMHYPAGDAPYSIAIGDLDGDQVPDLAVTTQWNGGGYVSVLLGLGDGTFAGATRYAAGDASGFVAIGDLDGDQVPDLAVTTWWNGTGQVSVLLGLGDGTFAPAMHYAAGRGPNSLAIGDLDGDQVLDLAVANGGSTHQLGNVSVLLGLGDGTFAAAVHYAAADRPVSIAIGDLDGDQVPDLAVANSSSQNVSVLLGLGDGTFAGAVHYAAGRGPFSVAIGDLDGDQVPDLAVASAASNNVSVLLGVGDGTFAPAIHHDTGNAPIAIAIGDLDGDQVPDLAVAIEAVTANVSVLLGVGDGTFAAALHYAADDGPFYVAIGDLDGDQVPDLAVANWFSDNVSVLLGVGGGTFAPALHYGAGSGPWSLAIGDLDGDQAPDLAVANFVGDSVSVLLGIGDGTFARARHYLAGDGPRSVAIADLDGDQVPDLAVANLHTDNVSVLLGVGDGTMAPAVQYAVGRRPHSVAIGDLDGDQVPDLAVANSFSRNVSVLLGVGDGTFAAAVPYRAGSEPVSIAIGDLDGDQVPDLAVANMAAGKVSVLLGVGDGTFGAVVHYLAGYRPFSVAIGDLDGDQVPDLAVANIGGNVSVLLGVGNGTFATALHYASGRVRYATGRDSRSVAIGDLNDDQKPDLAVANGPGDDVSVLLNQRELLGDLNCDDRFNGGDIDPFFLALGDPAAYAAQFPGCDVMLGDMNCDGQLNAADIDAFFSCLGGNCGRPVINQQPQSQTLCLRERLILMVGATGGDLSYQWRKNGRNIGGATQATYIVGSVTLADAGDYDVQITAACGTVVSSSVAITVAELIFTHPLSQTVCENDPVIFIVGVLGQSPTYQWRKDGVAIGGATASFFVIPAAQLSDVGVYDVAVTSPECTQISEPATLTVRQCP